MSIWGSFAYSVAVFTSSLVVFALQGATVCIAYDMECGILSASPIELIPAWFLGFAWTFFTALPGFLISIFLINRSRKRDAWVYSLAGVVTALSAFLISIGILSEAFHVFQERLIAWQIAIGGAVGGYTYFWWNRKFSSAGTADSDTVSE